MTSSIIGIDTTTGQRINIFKLSRLLGSYAIGLQGMGKSGLFEELIIQDIRQGIGVCVLDPHGELIEHVIARLSNNHEQDVILLDSTDEEYPFGLNLFECSNPTNDSAIMKPLRQVLHAFEKAFGISPTTPLMYDLLYKTAYVLIANPGYSMVDIPLLLTNEVCRKKLVANVTDPYIRKFWNSWDDPKQKSPKEQQTDSYPLLNKLNDFLHAPLHNIVGQSQSTINLQQIMEERKILLVKLSKQQEQATSLIGSIIVALILNAADARLSHKQFHLYADEFQRFATEDFATLLEEARKSGIGVTMAHQNRAQLELSDKQADVKLKARTLNVGNLIVFRVPTDAYEIAGQFDCTPPPAEIRPEPILTIKQDILNHLITNGHSNHTINKFSSIRLVQFKKNLELEQQRADHRKSPSTMWDEPWRFAFTNLNKLFYDVMSTNPYQIIPIETFFQFARFGTGLSFPYLRLMLLIPGEGNLNNAELLVEEIIVGYYEKRNKALQLIQALEPSAEVSAKRLRQVFSLLWTSKSSDLVKEVVQQICRDFCSLYLTYYDSIIGELSYNSGSVLSKLQQGEQAIKREIEWKKEYLSRDEDCEQDRSWWHSMGTREDIESRIMKEAGLMIFIPSVKRRLIQKVEQEVQKVWEQESKRGKEICIEGKRRLIAEIADAEKKLIENRLAKQKETERIESEIQQEILDFETLVFELREILQLLAAEPVMGQSGQYEEKPILRTFADMQNEIANALVKLPKYTAKVKLTDENDTVVEHVIETLKPGTGLFGKALQERVDRIRKQNRTPSKPSTLPYCRPRRDIEEEIRLRQEQCSQQSQQQPRPQPQQSPPQRKQILVCQKCGVTNQPGAKFCNQCGRPI